MSREKKQQVQKPTGKQIKKALIDLDMRQYDLAQELGVSTIYVRYIVAERRKAPVLREQIAQYLATELKRMGYPRPTWAPVENNQQEGVQS